MIFFAVSFGDRINSVPGLSYILRKDLIMRV